MTPLVYVAMFGFIPFGLWLYDRYPPRTACAAIFVIGWIILPQAKFSFPVIPDYTKGSALGICALICVFSKDKGALSRFRFGLIDLPIVAWCSAPFFSSVTNGLGAWDGMSAALGHVMDWGIPFFVGRLYFGSLEGMRELAIGMFLGGLATAPLACIEMVISPQLHLMLYGWFPHDFSQTRRWGGWRPVVFMEHGLELAMWMIAATFIGWQLALRKTLAKEVPFFKVPLFPAVIGLTLVTILCKSSGALVLLLIAIAIFQVCTMTRSAIPFLLLLLVPILYMNTRATGAWDGENLVDAATRIAGADRAGSLGYRLFNENLLVEKARKQMLFGWAGYKRSFVTDEEGKFVSVPDGMWILTYGKNGLFGLTALTACILVSPLIFAFRWPGRTWQDPLVAPAAAFAVFLGVFMIDNLLNAMYNPIMMLAAGGLSGLVVAPKALAARPARQSPERNEQCQVPVTRVI